MDAMQLANSLPMWLACGTAVLLVVFQAVIFTKKAMDAAGDKMAPEDGEEVKNE